jgi:hypothetical protein
VAQVLECSETLSSKNPSSVKNKAPIKKQNINNKKPFALFGSLLQYCLCYMKETAVVITGINDVASGAGSLE